MSGAGHRRPFRREDWQRDGRGWYVARDADTFALSRSLPVRWDVEARAVLPDLARRRLAHAVRQDLWRMLQNIRGFAPAVEVTRTEVGCAVRAGGAVAGRVPATLAARIDRMLHDPAQRASWVRAAKHREAA
ncbi:MAG: hypothetical protein WBA67_10085 [Jannaschia sp.]